jgi:hypothetical protein
MFPTQKNYNAMADAQIYHHGRDAVRRFVMVDAPAGFGHYGIRVAAGDAGDWLLFGFNGATHFAAVVNPVEGYHTMMTAITDHDGSLNVLDWSEVEPSVLTDVFKILAEGVDLEDLLLR